MENPFKLTAFQLVNNENVGTSNVSSCYPKYESIPVRNLSAVTENPDSILEGVLPI